MIQKNIIERQNEPNLLKCQFAARHYYNTAEIFNKAVWALCLLSALTIFIPEANTTAVIVVPLVLDILGAICEWFFEKCVSNGSMLRNYFDAYVLDINIDKYSKSDIRKIKALYETISEKYPKQCLVQIKNTGRDTPPGVLNWYEFAKDYSDTEVKYECQRTNCFWNKNMNLAKIKRFVVFGIISTVLIHIVACSQDLQQELLRILLCSGFVLKIFERIYEYIKYYHVSISIKAICDLIDTNITDNNIKHLQTLINKLRKIPVLGINSVYVKNTKIWSERNEKLSL